MLFDKEPFQFPRLLALLDDLRRDVSNRLCVWHEDGARDLHLLASFNRSPLLIELGLEVGELDVFLTIVDAVVMRFSFYFVDERAVEICRELIHSLSGKFVSNLGLTLDGTSDLLTSEVLFRLACFTTASCLVVWLM